MSSVYQLIATLREKGVRVRLNSGDLAVDAPKGSLRKTDIDALRAHKSELVDVLAAYAANKRQEPLTRQPRGKSIPLSFAQERLWFLDQLEGIREAYNVPVSARLGGKLDVSALKAALDVVVARHEILRTSFHQVDGEPKQVVVPRSAFALREYDLTTESPEERVAVARRHVLEEARRPFDLAVDTPIRVSLLRLSDCDHILCMTMHHIVCDGWSLSVLMQELDHIYSAYKNGSAHSLRDLPIQYADYAIWQRRHFDNGTFQYQLEILEASAFRSQRHRVAFRRNGVFGVESCRRKPHFLVLQGSLVRDHGYSDGMWRNSLHDVAGRISSAFIPPEWSARYRRGDAHRGTDASRNRNANRIFRQHGHDSCGCRWESIFCTVDLPSEDDSGRGARTSGRAVPQSPR